LKPLANYKSDKMETKKNSETNEDAHLELVLEEFINEQKSQIKSINDLAVAITSYTDKLDNIEREINNLKPISGPTNTQPILDVIKTGITDIKRIATAQEQKPIVKKFQLLLFPEHDAKLFYKIVFGRWFLWLTVMLFLTNLYKFSTHVSDNAKEIKLQQLETDRVKKAWFRLYSLKNRTLRKLMDTAYLQGDQSDH
jgi:hypothetical protein